MINNLVCIQYGRESVCVRPAVLCLPPGTESVLVAVAAADLGL